MTVLATCIEKVGDGSTRLGLWTAAFARLCYRTATWLRRQA